MHARIRCSPEDFVVDEIPAYAPSGRGEHLFVTFRKRGVTTLDAVTAIARALGVDPRGAGFAGMKDRHAVTTQTASFPFPIARDAEGAAAALSLPGIEILGAARHDNKLKPGHLVGNRFVIVLREVEEDAVPELCARLAEIGRVGVPNAFGPQRFGRDGDNPARALAWLAGKERGPRDRRQQRLLFSSLQSLLYNRVLERRVAAGTWAAVLPGDVAKKHDTGGLFDVPLEGPELDDARARAEAGAISATGPMFGAKMRWPAGVPAAIEREVLDEGLAAGLPGAAATPVPPGVATLGSAGAQPLPPGVATIGSVGAQPLQEMPRFEAFRQLGEGTRRALRLPVAEMAVETVAPGSTDPAGQPGRRVGVAVRFVLPKGGYATTVLERACHVVDATRPGAPGAEEPQDEEAQEG